jgi:hypothetical protein
MDMVIDSLPPQPNLPDSPLPPAVPNTIALDSASTLDSAPYSIPKATDENGVITIMANHVLSDYASDKGISVYRWVDGQHDFEPKFSKGVINKLLRGQYGVGTESTNMKKFSVIGVDSTKLAICKTTASRNTLHEILDYEWLWDEISDTVAHVEIGQDNISFDHKFPKFLPDIQLADITNDTPPVLTTRPEGDILFSIIGHKDRENTGFSDSTAKIRKFLGIQGSAYTKDAANIVTTTFQKIFSENNEADVADGTFFSEILDPAPEQADITNANVQITLLYCYVSNTPVYITLKKDAVKDKPHGNMMWNYAFHTTNGTPNGEYHKLNWTDNPHSNRAPNIDTASIYISQHIDRKIVTASGKRIVRGVKRSANVIKKKLFPKKMTKKELQNVKKNTNGAFDEFYGDLLDKLGEVMKKTLTSEEKKVAIIAFKTIGDQMYLYDSILLAENKQAEPWMVTGDTFLKDYSIYTKSANVMSPTKYGTVDGMRKLTVYLKPRKTDKESIILANKVRENAYERRRKEDDERLKRYNELFPKPAKKFTPSLQVSPFCEAIRAMQAKSSGRKETKFIHSGSETIFDHMSIILLYYSILVHELICEKIKILEETIERSEYKEEDFKNLSPYEQTGTIDRIKSLLAAKQGMIKRINEVDNLAEATDENIIKFVGHMMEGIIHPEDLGVSDDNIDLTKPIKYGPASLFGTNRTNMRIVSDIVSNIKSTYVRGRAMPYVNEYSFFNSAKSTMVKHLNSIYNNDMTGGKVNVIPTDHPITIREEFEATITQSLVDAMLKDMENMEDEEILRRAGLGKSSEESENNSVDEEDALYYAYVLCELMNEEMNETTEFGDHVMDDRVTSLNDKHNVKKRRLDQPSPAIIEMGGGDVKHHTRTPMSNPSREWKSNETFDGTSDGTFSESSDDSSDESDASSTTRSFNNEMVPYVSTDNPTNATELAERDMAMMRQFLEATQNKKEVGENLRNVLSANTNNGFLEGVVRDYRVFRGAIDVARQEKIDALKMVAEHVEKTKQMKELTAAELNRVLVQQKHLLAMLRELRDGGGKKKS